MIVRNAWRSTERIAAGDNMKATEKIDIVLASDNGAFCGLLVAACTAADCADRTVELVFHILDGGISDSDFAFFEKSLGNCNPNVRVNRIRVSQETFNGCPSYHGSRMAYARLLLPKILPDVGRVIYFDTDFYWRADVVRLWKETADVVSIAPVLDQNPGGIEKERLWYERNGLSFPAGRYFCTGSCVINLDRWRKDGIMDKAFDFIRKYPTVECAEQTALNVILKPEEVKLMPFCWGRFVRLMTPDEFKQPAALHFSAESPWSASRATKMLTDAQLLWFKTDAKLRGTTVWRSLRRYYSPIEIFGCRLIYIVIMKMPPFRWAFHLFLAKTGRCFFDERV